MKNSILTIMAIALVSLGLQAQTNTFPASGNVGIGTTSPTVKLEVVADAINRRGIGEEMARFYVSDAPQGDYLKIQNGTSLNGEFIPTIQAYHASNAREAMIIGATIESNRDQGDLPVMTFNTRVPGNTVDNRPLFRWQNYTTNVMTLTADGSLGIGTTTPDELLTVKGKIHAQEVIVDLQGAVAPDYVFEKYYEGSSELDPTYRFASLEEIETYTREHHHLPGMPSAAEIAEEGYELGEMNRVLLEKVEELTLLLIEQNKQLAQQEQRIKQLETK